MNAISVRYFSDVLCVWAYVAQARLDELKLHYADQISVRYHFIPIYGNTQKRVIEKWAEKGGIEAYVRFIRSVVDDFGHVSLAQDFWQPHCQPKSSASIHLFLKAAEHVINEQQLASGTQTTRTLFEELIWQFRHRYFAEACNIGLLENQCAIAEAVGIPSARIRECIDDGTAMAAMCTDNELKEDYQLQGSPTYVMNEGRQILYGNVGYKIIAANIEELLHRPQGVASWC